MPKRVRVLFNKRFFKNMQTHNKKLEQIRKKKVRYPEIGSIYEHYKGGKYKVLHLARHSETKQVLVIYQSLEFGDVHARPLKMWFDEIVKNTISRFRFLQKS